jgi:hypothetical protein
MLDERKQNMKDYQIIQRDENDWGIAHFDGYLPEDAPDNVFVFGYAVCCSISERIFKR